MITLYVPIDQVTKETPNQWSFARREGWAQIQVSQETFKTWQSKSESVNSAKKLLHG